jgi:hypothetical protein
LKLKARFDSGPSYLDFKSIDSGAFNRAFIGLTCTAIPLGVVRAGRGPLRVQVRAV